MNRRQARPGTPVAIVMKINIQHALGVSYRQVLGAAMTLLKEQKAGWRGLTLVGVTP